MKLNWGFLWKPKPKALLPAHFKSDRPSTHASEMIDRSAWCLYDWMVEQPGAETRPVYTLWTTPMGSHPVREYERASFSGYRTNADTSFLMIGGMLPIPQAFLVNSIHTFYGITAADDRDRFREAYTLEFVIAQKSYYQIPLAAIPPHGCLLTNDLRIDPPADWPRPQPNEFAEYPRYIPALCHSEIRLTGRALTLDPDGHGLRFLPIVLGQIDRSVQ